MSQANTQTHSRVAEVVATYGRCLELVGMDPHFHDITVSLYEKDGVCTVWSFSGLPGTQERLRAVRDQLVAFGGMRPVEGARNQAFFDCGDIHERPLKFLIRQAVEKDPARPAPSGPITVKDTRTGLTLKAVPGEMDGRPAYLVEAEGEARNPRMRIRTVVGGFMRYGDMERLAPDAAAFKCGARHDELVRLLLPYARNVSSVEDMLEADALAGQMTTQTLGFSSSV